MNIFLSIQRLISFPSLFQKEIIEHLSQLRQQQLEQFEEMNKLEIRILCRILPKSINDLDRFIPTRAINDDRSIYESVKKQQKQIRDLKRQMILEQFEKFESSIEENEILYQKELFNLELQLSDEMNNDLMISIYNYLHSLTMNKIRSIRFNETIFRHRLLHPRHRRSTKTNNNNSISIYPEAIIEIFEQIFNKKELDFLSSLGKIIILSLR